MKPNYIPTLKAAATVAGCSLLLVACGSHVRESREAMVQRETSLIRCSVISRRAGEETIVVIRGRVAAASFDFRRMSFRIGRMEGGILHAAVSSDGHRTAALSGGGVVSFPRRGEIGQIVFDDGARVDEIYCG